MSLLLDALKKADDLNTKNIPQNKSVNLDLDLTDEAICLLEKKNKTDDDFGKDQMMIMDTAPAIKLSLEEKSENLENEEIGREKTGSVSEIDELKNAHSTVIENEQALSGFIKHFNQYCQREKFKKNIGIVIFISLFLVTMGIYFYIEIQASQQSLYISSQVKNFIAGDFPDEHNHIKPEISSGPDSDPALDDDYGLSKATGVVPLKKQVEDSVVNAVQKSQKTTQNISGMGETQITSHYKSKIVARSTDREIKAKDITIIHGKKADPVQLLMSDAYKLFNNQSYVEAEKHYKNVLVHEPVNREAWLGLAAIAIKEKRYQIARQRYQYLIGLNPKDSFAIAGLSMLDRDKNTQLNESNLKFMIKQQPESAHLNFALGSQYAAQDKWPEAQSAYFSAWSAEVKNADYSYNLAVSLDHLDKKKQALKFYKLSLKLKRESNGGFIPQDVQDRIHALQEIK